MRFSSSFYCASQNKGWWWISPVVVVLFFALCLCLLCLRLCLSLCLSVCVCVGGALLFSTLPSKDMPDRSSTSSHPASLRVRFACSPDKSSRLVMISKFLSEMTPDCGMSSSVPELPPPLSSWTSSSVDIDSADFSLVVPCFKLLPEMTNFSSFNFDAARKASCLPPSSPWLSDRRALVSFDQFCERDPSLACPRGGSNRNRRITVSAAVKLMPKRRRGWTTRTCPRSGLC